MLPRRGVTAKFIYSVFLMTTKFKKIKTILPGFLDESVDATYIIHKLGNGRLEQVKEELARHQPTTTIYLLCSPGWREKQKQKNQKHINSSAIDLVDNNLLIFKHAAKKEYKNILVLEDDFFFNEKMFNSGTQQYINAFLKENQDTKMLYLLGCLPFFSIPYFWKGAFFNNYFTFFAATHCCIYTRLYRDDFLRKGSENHKKMFNWDYENLSGIMYHEPLCYQLFSQTENQGNWAAGGPKIYSFIMSVLMYISKLFIKIVKLDSKPEPGYMMMYVYSKLFFIYLAMLFLFFIGFLLFLIGINTNPDNLSVF